MVNHKYIWKKIDLKSYKIMDWKDPDGELLRLLTQLSVGSQFLERVGMDLDKFVSL